MTNKECDHIYIVTEWIESLEAEGEEEYKYLKAFGYRCSKCFTLIYSGELPND